jgi:pimeloyl-ACP methyl ester carboxylesterase
LAGNEALRGAGLDGIVAESSYCRLGELQRRLLKRLFNLGDRFVGVLLREKVKQRLGYLLDSVDLSEAAAAASVPALFVSGGQEILPGFAESQAVQEGWGGPSRLLLLQGSYRALGLTEGDAYRAAILELFKEEA